MKLKLNEFSKKVYEDNKLRGFDAAKDNIGQLLMLVVSELSEALEADRKDRYCERTSIALDNMLNEDESFVEMYDNLVKGTFEEEIADSIIRMFDLCGGLDIDIEKHIALKLKYNSTRKYKHGKKY